MPLYSYNALLLVTYEDGDASHKRRNVHLHAEDAGQAEALLQDTVTAQVMAEAEDDERGAVKEVKVIQKVLRSITEAGVVSRPLAG